MTERLNAGESGWPEVVQWLLLRAHDDEAEAGDTGAAVVVLDVEFE